MHLTEDQWGKGTLTPRMTTDFDLSLDNSPLLQSIHQLDFVQMKGACLCPPVIVTPLVDPRAGSRIKATCQIAENKWEPPGL